MRSINVVITIYPLVYIAYSMANITITTFRKLKLLNFSLFRGNGMSSGLNTLKFLLIQTYLFRSIRLSRIPFTAL